MAGMIQTTQSGALRSELPSAPTQEFALPNIPPEPDFIYMADPRKWDLYQWADGTPELLPFLSKLKIEAGVGGVTESGDYTLALTARRRRGQIEIPRAHGTEDDYVRTIRVRSGWLFHEKWRTFVAVGNTYVERVDMDGYLTFLRDVATTFLPEPMSEILQGRGDQYRARKVRQEEAAARNPARLVDVAATDARLAALDEVAEAIVPPVAVIPPAPRKRGRPPNPKPAGLTDAE